MMPSREVARPLQEFLQPWIVASRRQPCGRHDAVMGGDVPPFIQILEVPQPRMVRRIMRRHPQREAEPAKILLEIIDIWISAIKLTAGGELLLYEDAQSQPDFGRYYLSAFRVKVAAEPLKMSRQQEDVGATILVDQVRIGGDGGAADHALRIDFAEPDHPVCRPVAQRTGWHAAARATGDFGWARAKFYWLFYHAAGDSDQSSIAVNNYCNLQESPSVRAMMLGITMVKHIND